MNSLRHPKLRVEQLIAAHKRRRHSTHRYEVMAANCQDIILFLRAEDGQILEANQAAILAYGYSYTELLEKSVVDIRADTTLDLVVGQMAQAQQNGILFETYHKHKDGRVFPVEVNSKGIMVDGENVIISIIRDISKRKRVEQALYESEERYRSLFIGLLEGFALQEVLYDENGLPIDFRFIEANPLFEQLIGHEREDILGKLLSDILPSDFSDWVNLFSEIVNSGQPAHIERYFDRLQQHYDMYVYCPTKGQLAITFTNVTKRKLADDALRTLSSAVEYSPASVVITDIDGQIEYINPKFSELTGYSNEEALGQNPRILKSDYTPEGAYAQLWETILSGKTWQGQFRNKKKDGSYYWESASISPITDEHGVTTHFVAVKEDITTQKQLEQELQAQRDFAMQVMNTMGQGLSVTGPDGRFEYVNPAYAQLLNLPPADIIGKFPSDTMEIVNRTDAADLHADPNLRSTSYEARLKRIDGSKIPVLVTDVPRMINGSSAGTISVITNLTEQKEVEEQLRRMGTIDILTGTYNRTYFDTELALFEKSHEYPISLLVADIDNLKITNDTLGHAMGDVLIKRAAEVLKSATRTADPVARIGGDEFAVILPNTSSQEASCVIERIESLIQTVNSKNQDVVLSISLGSATSSKGNLIQTFKLADATMYENKRNRKLLIQAEKER